MNNRWIAIGSLLAAAVVTAVAVSSVASATASGKNGQIAFRRYFDKGHTWGAIFVINANGKGTRQVTHPPRGTKDDQPDWAPGGSRITFERCPSNGVCRVATIRPDGSDLQYLTPDCSPGQECADIRGPAYSPDGKRIVFGQASGQVKSDPVVGDQIERFSLQLMDANGENVRTVYAIDNFKGDINYPQVSPNGTQIVFERANSSRSEPKGARAVFIISVDGTGLHRITPWAMNGGDAPNWSPDGKLILFRSNVESDTKQSQVYVVRPKGSGMKQLTHFKQGTIVTSSSFSPDGN
jgi:Tol biopolymer transport system component